MTVEEFIARVIRHIPDENFKTIRYYGVYARRIKKICKELVSNWQKEARKWIVQVKKRLKRRSWREKIQRASGNDPLGCPKCECYYEYKGEVCLEEGKLKIRYAACRKTKGCLERMIYDLTGIEETKASEEKEKQTTEPKQAPAIQGVRQVSVFDVLAERGDSVLV